MWASSSSGLASSSVQRLRQTSERYLEAILTADVEDPSENTGPGGDLHLTHHQAKEGLHCMGTDPMPVAISLLVIPCKRKCRVSLSRGVRWNFCPTIERSADRFCRSSTRTCAGATLHKGLAVINVEIRALYRRRRDRKDASGGGRAASPINRGRSCASRYLFKG